jgi:RNA polymerase-binding transcription factor DksA
MTDQNIDITHYKQILEEEMDQLVSELRDIGRIDPKAPNDWNAVANDLNEPRPKEPAETADKIANYADNVIIVERLEERFHNVKAALERIEEGAYGTCEVCGGEIEKERLDANAAARTCTKHME